MADDGKFLARPDGAAPLFDSKSGKAAARKRWDCERENTEQALIDRVEEELGKEVSLAEAVNFAINHPLIEKALTGNVPALKFLTQKLDLVPVGSTEATQPTQQTNQQVNFYSFGTPAKVLAYAKELESSGQSALAALVRSQINEDEEAQVIEVPID
ncbi:hypothetical protein LCGC14_2588310 [marine sediment metagenome]|uniref:Uncharacterized protein n=1 Tax=marine sediment metagenome TaxID=412755 RepID=A0A0F9ACD6_9ZZZZ